MPSLTKVFTDYLFEKAQLVTNDLLRKANSCSEDYFAVTVAGAKKNKSHWNILLDKVPCGSAELIGFPQKVDSRMAAFINGFNAHTLELDDGHRFAMIHLGAPVISAIKAAADDFPIHSKALQTGIIMGYEAACRVSIAIQPSHKNRGFHATGTCGTIGAAVGVAFALEMSKEQVTRVLSCAIGSAAGMLEIQEQGSEIKPYNVGRASLDGLMSAYMGLTDFGIPDDMLGGERGFFRLFSDQTAIEKLTEQTKYFEIERIYVKPYASCRHSHSAVEAAIRLHGSIEIEKIDKIIVQTYKLGVKGHDHTVIQGTASAKLSTPYAVAAGLIYGHANITVFDPVDDRVIDLAKKVTVIEDPKLTAENPQKRIAVVMVYMDDGATKTCKVDYAKGDPENPMTDEELEKKKNLLLAYSAN